MSIIKELFKPILEIYPSEFRRKIFLDEFLKYAFEERVEDSTSPVYSLGLKNNLEHIFRSYEYVLETLDYITIASFISYLGTNGGLELQASFERNSESKFFRDKEEAFLYSWLKHNARQVGINNNYRTIEYILTPLEKHDLHRGLNKFCIDDIKPTQYEVIEHLIKWLSTSEGIIYILTCQDLIKQERDKTHEIRKMVRNS